LFRDEEGRKPCSKCHRFLEEELFDRKEQTLDKKDPHCRDCKKDQKLRYLYGMGLREYTFALEFQGKRCHICGVHESVPARGLSIDHDHSCCSGRKVCGKCVRSFLCMKCNTGLGNFLDSPELLRAAADYVELWKDRRELADLGEELEAEYGEDYGAMILYGLDDDPK